MPDSATVLTTQVSRPAADSSLPARWKALLVVLVVAAYSPVVLATYGFSDDYRIVYGLQRDHADVTHVLLGNGRPGMLALHWLASFAVDDVAGMRWLRLITILGLAFVAVRVATLARDAGRSQAVSLSLALAVVTLPPSQVTASWSLMWVVPLAALVAIQAACLADRGGLIAPALLLIAAILIYQPAAMCYWLPLVIAADRRRRRTDVYHHAAVLGLAAAAGALAWMSGRGFSQASGRSHLTSHALAQADWFLTYVLPRALSPAPISTPPSVTLALLVFLIGGLVIAEGRSPIRLALLLAAIPASYATSLVVQADLPSARSMFALGPVLVVLYVRACDGWRTILPSAVARYAPSLAVLCALILAAAACRSVQIYFAAPQGREWQLVSDAVAGADLHTKESIGVTQSDWNHFLAPARSLDEFGMLSSTFGWVPVPMVELARRDLTGSWSGHTTLSTRPGPGVLNLDTAIVRGG
jgi:hypothetical protein